MKEYKKQIIITSVITILPMLAGILLWGRMPDKVAVHWGIWNAGVPAGSTADLRFCDIKRSKETECRP